MLTECVIEDSFSAMGILSRLGISTLLGLATSSLAGANQLCASSQLNSFRFKGVARFIESDYCKLSDEQVPLPVKSFIASLAEQHKKASALFGLTAAEALGNAAIDFRMSSSPLGALSSAVNTGDRPVRLYYGVFSDWNGDGLERGIYTHELGHVLSLSGNPLLPKAYLELSTTSLATETVADALAMQTEGSVMGNSEKPESCVHRLRKIDSHQSYDMSEEFFTLTWSKRSLLSCCKQILGRTPSKPHWGEVCKDIISKSTQESPLPPVDRQNLFEPSRYLKDPMLFDPHQLGIPINSFLKDLHERSGLDANALFIEAFRSASTEGPDYSQFRCKVPKLNALIPSVLISQVSMGTVLNRLKQNYNSNQQLVFEQLWQKHGLDKAVEIGAFDATALAVKKTIPTFIESFKKANQDSALQEMIKTTGCNPTDIGSFGPWAQDWTPNANPTAGCGITCEKIKD